MTTNTPSTKRQAYEELKDAGEDVSLRLQVAAALDEQPDTTAGLAKRFEDRSANAIRPRVNELLRMDCVERDGKRENRSGHEAYVHHLTERGARYLAGEIEPSVGPTVAVQAKAVVSIARGVVTDQQDLETLRAAVQEHDETKAQLDPEFVSPLLDDEDETEPGPPSIGEAIREVIENADAPPTREELTDAVTALVDADRDAVEKHLRTANRQGLLYETNSAG